MSGAEPKPSGQIWTCWAAASLSAAVSCRSPSAARCASPPYFSLSVTSIRPSVRRNSTRGTDGSVPVLRSCTPWRIALGKSVPVPSLFLRLRSLPTHAPIDSRPAASSWVRGHTGSTARWSPVSAAAKPNTVTFEDAETSPIAIREAAAFSAFMSAGARLADSSTPTA